MSEIDGPFVAVGEYGDELMELELVYLGLLGPRARAACTPCLDEVEDGERRFVVEVAGPGVMRLVEVMAEDPEMEWNGGEKGNDPLHWGRYMGERKRGRGEGATGNGWLRQKKRVERPQATPK